MSENNSENEFRLKAVASLERLGLTFEKSSPFLKYIGTMGVVLAIILLVIGIALTVSGNPDHAVFLFIAVIIFFSTSTLLLYKKTKITLQSKDRFQIITGTREAIEVLTGLTLAENSKVRVTRFSPKMIQRYEEYFSAVGVRITGGRYGDKEYKKLDGYDRLVSLNSDENKESITHMVKQFRNKNCDNFVIRITASKNDYELLIFEDSKIAALCFHDISKKYVLHSCLITNDPDLFVQFDRLYKKIWDEDIIMEIDFSASKGEVNSKMKALKEIEPFKESRNQSPIDNILHCSNRIIQACNKIKDSKIE
jgi:hypothetical protein